MTKDDIMKMAREAWMPDPMVFFSAYERFADMVASAEREACIKACKEQRHQLGEDEAKIGGLGIAMCANAIQARSKK